MPLVLIGEREARVHGRFSIGAYLGKGAIDGRKDGAAHLILRHPWEFLQDGKIRQLCQPEEATGASLVLVQVLIHSDLHYDLLDIFPRSVHGTYGHGIGELVIGSSVRGCLDGLQRKARILEGTDHHFSEFLDLDAPIGGHGKRVRRESGVQQERGVASLADGAFEQDRAAEDG